MFAYCNNNPVCNTDSAGNIPRSITGAEIAESKEWQRRQAVKRIIRKTTLEKKTVTDDGVTYNTYTASVSSNAFRPWFHDSDELNKLVQEYAESLHERIDKKIASDPNSKWWTMSTNHIYSEAMAHIRVHISSAGFVSSALVADLNVDESRNIVLALMKLWGYDSELDNEKY